VNDQIAVPCSVIRGGTSKGLYFHAGDLPSESARRDAILLAALGSPDAREIDGMGGGHPLTSKVAIVKISNRPVADVDYLFLQIWPDRAEVSDSQNCGNLLAGVGPFAIEEGLVTPTPPVTRIRIWMENTNTVAIASVETPDGKVRYDGQSRIEFLDVAGSSCGSLLPSGNAVDIVEGVRVTCIDNGMPVVCVKADDVGLTGYEEPADIEGNVEVCEKVERIRRAAGILMNLGDVSDTTVPKVSLLAPAKHGGAIMTRTFIPTRVHEAIGVFGAVSVATACLIAGSIASEVAGVSTTRSPITLDIEHPSGYFSVSLVFDRTATDVIVSSAALLRTARLLMRGDVFVPRSKWM
jgi:4-oxalomesaconate tautomerase